MVEGINNECYELKDTSMPYPCTKMKFWKKYIKLPLPPHDLVFYAQGSLFSVTKEQLHRRPLEDYRNLLDDLTNSSGIYMGLLMEFFWFPLVTSLNTFCDQKYYNPITIPAKMQKTLTFLGEECLKCRTIEIKD